MPQRGHRDRLGIDGVRLARLARRPARAGHQPGLHPDHRLPGTKQLALEPAGQAPAVLQPELDAPLELDRPLQQPQLPGRVRPDVLHRHPAPYLVDRHRRVGRLMGIHPNHDDHPLAPSCPLTVVSGTVAGRARLNRARWQAPIKPRPATLQESDEPAHRGQATPHKASSKEKSEARRTCPLEVPPGA